MDDKNPPRDTGVSEQNSRSGRGGRPEYKPTDEQRALVRQLVADKVTKTEIARKLGISPVTLRKHFAEELGREVAAPVPGLVLEGAHVPEKPAPGRPEYEPSQRHRDSVRLWAAADWSEDRMARQLGISRNTLRKHFAEELEFGADAVHTEVLLDLKRASREGKVAASNRLLEMLKLVAPPTAPKAVPAEPESEPLGKKAQAKVDAKTAEQGTGWVDLVH